jgi:hypothetical protein
MEALAVDRRKQLVFQRGQQKRRHRSGQLADLAVLSSDYFSIPDEEIKHLESVLTSWVASLYAAEGAGKGSTAAPVLPEWSPLRHTGLRQAGLEPVSKVAHAYSHVHHHRNGLWLWDALLGLLVRIVC